MKKILNCAGILLLWAAPVLAAVPGYLNFQGRLLDSNKLPRTGTYTIVFKICDSLAGACTPTCSVADASGCLWTESQNLTVTNGVFSAQLGAVTTLGSDVFSSDTRYLDITVAGETLTPRERLAAGPYSFKAAVADGLANNDGSALLKVSSIALAGFYNAPGVRSNLGLGIGTDVQAYNANLTTLAGLDGSGLTGVKTSSVALAGFYNAPGVRANLGLAIGTDVQAYNANLADLADGSLTGSLVGAGVPAANIASGSLGASVIASSHAVASVLDASIVSLSASKLSGALPAVSGASLTSLTAANISAGTLGAGVIASSVGVNTVYDGAVTGSISGSKIGSGVAAANIASGSLGGNVIASSIAVGGVYDNALAAARVKTAGDTMTGPLTLSASSLTVTGALGISASNVLLGPNVAVSSEASSALGAGVRISTNAYIVGFSSASMYYGNGSGLTDLRPFVAVSTAGISATLTANTEKLVVFSTITTVAANSQVLAMGNVFLYTINTATTAQARLRRSAAGGSCLTSSTLVYTFSGQHAGTTGLPLTLGILALDNPPSAGAYVYCIGVQSGGTDTVQSRNLAVIEVSPDSISSKL